MLKFNSNWRYTSPSEIAHGAVSDFFKLIRKIAAQGERKAILEHFKAQFAIAAGVAHNYSSNAGWAESDLETVMSRAAANAPLFIEAFYDGCKSLDNLFEGVGGPDIEHINSILFQHATGYQIHPPHLVSSNIGEAITLQPVPPSLDEQAQVKIRNSLKISEEFLSGGKYRQAVQEILWLLETISTAFKGATIGEATIQAKYFNKIVIELRQHRKGTTLERVLEGVTALHGYLSSPTGGIRHGTDLTEGVDMQANEARLWCNLTRSYIDFLIAEYDSLIRR